jgi:hypothetical protein
MFRGKTTVGYGLLPDSGIFSKNEQAFKVLFKED